VRLEPGQGNAARINFYGPEGTWRHYPFYSFMDDADFSIPVDSCETDYVETFADTSLYRLVFGDEPSPFRGKIAVLGVSATELHDDKVTPFFGYQGQSRLMPGVEVHAHAVQTMLDGSWVVNPLPGWRAWLVFALIAMGGSWLASRLGPLRGLLLLLGVQAAWLAAAQWAFNRHNLWLEVAAPAVALVGAWTVNVLQQFLQARRERAQIRGMFAQYVPEAVVAELIKNPGLLVLGGEEREISALYSDVEGFTSISERLTPTQLVELLNEYLTEMTQLITDEGGIIDKYEGDAIIAEFGAPLPCADHARRAVRVALRMQERLAGLREGWAAAGKPQLRARIGINSGPMVVGNMGSRQIFDYTAMGDAMNLASRMEPANKHYGSYILLTEFCWRMTEGAFVGRQLDVIRVKGKDLAIEVWEPLGAADDPRAGEWRRRAAAWDVARAPYLAQDWGAALAAFEALAAADPADGAPRKLAERCRALLASPPTDWDGIWVMTDK
jgi:adenylate cyclase